MGRQIERSSDLLNRLARQIIKPHARKYQYASIKNLHLIDYINDFILINASNNKSSFEDSLNFDSVEEFKWFQDYFDYYGYTVNLKSIRNENEYNIEITWPWSMKEIDIEEDPNYDLNE